MAEGIHSQACGVIAPDVQNGDVACVRRKNHPGDHRGVAWIGNDPCDYYWPITAGGKHRAPVPSFTADDVWSPRGFHYDYDPKHRARMDPMDRDESFQSVTR